jgi:hypothetical protein
VTDGRIDVRSPGGYCFVSCDISGHSFESDLDEQVHRVDELNRLVRGVLESEAGAGAVWASGGDGGHLALRPESNEAASLEVVAVLRQWADAMDVPLRVAAHLGTVASTRGADDRVQLVGDGINFCGHLLDLGSVGAVVASQAYKEFIEGASITEARFDGPVRVYLKQRVPDSIYLLSIDGRFTSEWGDFTRGEHELLKKAARDLTALDAARGRSAQSAGGRQAEANDHRSALTWKIVYHAKRLLQANTADPRALNALEEVALREDLPDLFKRWDPTLFARFVQTAELVERRHGEAFCREGDEGDAMFVVLTGEVGVAAGRPDVEQRLDLRLGAGTVLGELALVLRGSRTATLQAVGDACVLSFNYERCRQFLKRAKSARTVQSSFEDLFAQRLSEFICNHCPSLVGMDRSGPLAAIPTARLSRYIMGALDRIELDRGAIVSPFAPEVSASGLYVLTRGELGNLGQTLSARKDLPVVYADLGSALVHMDQEFQARGSTGATLVHVDAEVFDRLDDAAEGRLLEEVADAVKRSLLEHYRFDVFLSYNRRDLELVTSIKTGLGRAGLRVFMDEPTTGSHFTPLLKNAILTSLAFVPVISSHVESSGAVGGPRSWVEMEVAFRQAAFDGEPNMFPVVTEGGDVEVVAGVSSVDASGRSEDYVVSAVAEAVRNRFSVVPFATRRITHPIEFEP